LPIIEEASFSNSDNDEPVQIEMKDEEESEEVIE
jgi:hypothetical protein